MKGQTFCRGSEPRPAPRSARFFAPHSLFLVVGLTAALLLPARAVDPEEYRKFLRETTQLRRQDPGGAAEKFRKYLETEELSGGQRATLSGLLADIEFRELKQPAKAFAILEQALEGVTEEASRLNLLNTKVNLLLENGQKDEVEKIILANWTNSSYFYQASSWLSIYLGILDESNRRPEALRFLKQAVTGRISTLDRQYNLLRQLTGRLVETGAKAEALRWAKLGFVVSQYNEGSLRMMAQLASDIQSSTSMLTPGGRNLAVLTALQTGEGKNPFTDVALPDVPQDELQAAFATAQTPADQIAILLVMGREREAMIAARGMMLARPHDADAVAQVCRVFKARDLNLKRANQYIEFLRTGTGSNPVTAFLAETAPGAGAVNGGKKP